MTTHTSISGMVITDVDHAYVLETCSRGTNLYAVCSMCELPTAKRKTGRLDFKADGTSVGETESPVSFPRRT